MGAMEPLLEEVRFEILKIIVLYSFVDTTIFFLGTLLVLSIFGIGLLLPFLLALVFFVADTWRRHRKFSLKAIEESNPEMREMLRTAADNRKSDTLMAHALFSEVIQKMRRVSSGSFLDLRRLGLKIALMFSLSIVLVSLAFFNVNIQKFENPLGGTRDRVGSFFGGLFGGDANIGAELEDADDIYGEPSIAQLGNRELDITLQQSLNQIDFNSVRGADPEGGQLRDYPVDVGVRASEAYTEGLEDVNDRKTAAEYSQQIKR